MEYIRCNEMYFKYNNKPMIFPQLEIFLCTFFGCPNWNTSPQNALARALAKMHPVRGNVWNITGEDFLLKRKTEIKFTPFHHKFKGIQLQQNLTKLFNIFYSWTWFFQIHQWFLAKEFQTINKRERCDLA